jgi:hypothetical protein
MRPLVKIVLVALLMLLCSSGVLRAQQPFETDDADVTPEGKFHFESFNEYDWLQLSQAPHLRQNTFNMKLNYGLGHRLELDLDSPLIAIVNDSTARPRVPFGFGDTDFGIKWNFREEHKGSSVPALTAVAYIETPTGDSTTSLGSGLVDIWVYGVAQKTLTDTLVLHLNGGWLFHGNTSTGVVGIVTAHGHVATMGGSIVRTMNERVTLGLDLTAAVTRNAALERNQFQAMLGGNYSLREGLSLDAAFIVGHFEASPRIGLQVGLSWDIRAEPQTSSNRTSNPTTIR